MPSTLPRSTWTLALVALLAAATARPACAQAPVSLGNGKVILPTAGLQVGYLAPPIRLHGSTGAIARDGMAKQMLLLPAAGEPVRLIGRFGEGPGEYRDVSSIWTNGDSLVFIDQSLRRASIFSANSGELIESWRVGLDTKWREALVQPVAVFNKECWLGSVTRALPRRRGAATIETVTVLILVHEVDGMTTVDSVFTRADANLKVIPLGEMGANRIPSATGTASQLAVAPDGHGFAVVEARFGAKSAIVIHSTRQPCAEPMQERAVPRAARELSRQEVADFYRSQLKARQHKGAQLEAAVEDAIDQTARVGGRFIAPLFSSAFLGAKGDLWVEVEGDGDFRDRGQERHWLRIPANAAPPESITVPSNIRLQTADRSRVLGWRTTDAGGLVIEFRMPGR